MNNFKKQDMKKQIYRVGDEVSIIPSSTHSVEIKKHYDKCLIIENIIQDSCGIYLYKLVGVAHFGLVNDLVPLLPKTEDQEARWQEVYKDYPFKLSTKKIDAETIINACKKVDLKDGIDKIKRDKITKEILSKTKSF